MNCLEQRAALETDVDETVLVLGVTALYLLLAERAEQIEGAGGAGQDTACESISQMHIFAIDRCIVTEEPIRVRVTTPTANDGFLGVGASVAARGERSLFVEWRAFREATHGRPVRNSEHSSWCQTMRDSVGDRGRVAAGVAIGRAIVRG